jgi:hypothetical protein
VFSFLYSRILFRSLNQEARNRPSPSQLASHALVARYLADANKVLRKRIVQLEEESKQREEELRTRIEQLEETGKGKEKESKRKGAEGTSTCVYVCLNMCVCVYSRYSSPPLFLYLLFPPLSFLFFFTFFFLFYFILFFFYFYFFSFFSFRFQTRQLRWRTSLCRTLTESSLWRGGEVPSLMVGGRLFFKGASRMA